MHELSWSRLISQYLFNYPMSLLWLKLPNLSGNYEKKAASQDHNALNSTNWLLRQIQLNFLFPVN